MKSTLQDLKDLFTFRSIQMETVQKVNPFKSHPKFHGAKHDASKKGYKHNWNPSKGQRRDIIKGVDPMGTILKGK